MDEPDYQNGNEFAKLTKECGLLDLFGKLEKEGRHPKLKKGIRTSEDAIYTKSFQ